jgi:CrcB protein
MRGERLHRVGYLDRAVEKAPQEGEWVLHGIEGLTLDRPQFSAAGREAKRQCVSGAPNLTKGGLRATDAAMWMTLIQVALGGALGAVLRYLTSVGAMRLVGPGFPWATMTVNVLGSFAMGVLVVVLAREGGTRLAPFFMTGVLGGFTTFSAFSLDALTLYERGQAGLAAGYVVASVLLSLGAIFAAILMMRSFAA